jgi:PAS domain S-box-containing protein
LKDRLAISFPLPAVHQRTEASLNDREKPLWLDIVIAPLYDRRKQLSGYLIMLNDISERKKAEEAQHRLAVIVESSHDAILSKTLDGIITTWNSGAEMLYGYPAEEAIGHPVSMLIPPESADEGRQFLEKVRRGEDVKDYEAVRITKDKRRINVLLTISPIHDMSGRIIAASTIAQDITKLRRAAEVLKESEKKYRDLFENANEAIFVAQDARLVFTNPTLTKLFGYSAEELSAKLFIEFIYPDDRDMVIDRHRRRLTGEELPPVYAFRVVRRDGNVRWVELSAVVIEWEGKPATLNFLSDITERTETEEALRESERKYRSLTEKMNDIVWIMGLDLRTTYVSPSVFKTSPSASGPRRHCARVRRSSRICLSNCRKRSLRLIWEGILPMLTATDLSFTDIPWMR